MPLLIVIGWILLPAIPAVLFYLSVPAFGLLEAARLAGILSFTWLTGQLLLASKPWNLEKILGTRGLYGLHGSMAILGTLGAMTHFIIKTQFLGVHPSAQTAPGFFAMLFFELSVVVALLLMSAPVLPKFQPLVSLRNFTTKKWGWILPRVRVFHNLTVFAVALIALHTLLAHSTRKSIWTFAALAIWSGFCLTMYMIYRIRGRKPLTA